MDKRIFALFCFLSCIALSYSVDHETQDLDNRRAYDLTGLVAKIANRLRNSLLHRDEDSLGDLLHFPGINFDFELKLSLPSFKCMLDLTYIYQNIKSQWALQMLDSFGKPESSIMKGNFRWIGDYNECVGTHVTNPNSTFFGNFNGKYCSLTWNLTSLNLSIPFSFVSGVCIPDSCSAKDLEEEAVELLKLAGVLPDMNDTDTVANSNAMKCKPTERHLNTAAKAVIILLSLIFTFTVLGSSMTAVKYFLKVFDDFKAQPSSVYTYENNQVIIKDDINELQKDLTSDDKSLLVNCEQENKSNRYLRKVENFFQCFCIFTNGAKILNTDTSEGELLCIHGIRFLSMSWVILGHTYIFGIAEMKNLLGILPIVDNFAFQAILQAFYSVDSFFVLSGFLLTYLFMKEYTKRKSQMSWAYFYIHRYIRLTPMYMILLGFSATVYFYLGSGPYWPDGDYDPACRDVWWRNLLYINNFDVEKGQCFGHSWYLANDMQFFVISPIFLITLFRWPKIGYTLLAIFLAASCLANYFIGYHFGLGNGLISFINKHVNGLLEFQEEFMQYFVKLYVKPYTRIGPYLIGMLAGYLLFKRKAVGNPKHSLMFISFGWVIATSVTLATVYGMYHTSPTLVVSSIYNALNRICFGLGLSWVIYVCLIGQGGVVNRILSFKLFIPLSRLTYAAYLIHPLIISGYFQTLTTSLEFSHSNIVVLFLGFMLITYGLALPVALILESPIVSLEKLIRKSFVKE